MKKYYAKQSVIGGHPNTLVFDSLKARNAYLASHDYSDPIPASEADKANAVSPEVYADSRDVGMIDIGHNIRTARLARGLTQKALAERIGVAQPRIAEWERGKVDPTGSTLSKIAAALGCSPGELLK